MCKLAVAPITMDFWNNINKNLQGLAENANIISFGVLILVLVVCGILLAVSEKTREKAKSWIPWALIGTAVSMMAPQIAKWYFDKMGF